MMESQLGGLLLSVRSPLYEEGGATWFIVGLEGLDGICVVQVTVYNIISRSILSF